MKHHPIVRRERWMSLLEVATLLKLNQVSQAARRRAALRVVRQAEQLNRTTITKRFGNRVYVSTVKVETLFPATDERIFNVEDGITKLAQQHRELNRKVRSYGARLTIVEKQQELTRKYLADMNAIEQVANGSETGARAGRL